MKVEDMYDHALIIINESREFTLQMNAVCSSEFSTYYKEQPVNAIKVFWGMLTSSSFSPSTIPTELEQSLRKKYSLVEDKLPHWENMLDVYFSKDHDLGLAREIKRRLPNVEFSRLLALQNRRSPKPGLIKNKKFLSYIAAFLFAIYTGDKFEITKGVKINLTDLSISDGLTIGIWCVLIIFFLYQVFKYFNNYKLENVTVVKAEKVFIAGKEIEK